MTERELVGALTEMMPNATNVIGFQGLLELEGLDKQPIRRIEYECHCAASGYALALQFHALVARLKAEGLE